MSDNLHALRVDDIVLHPIYGKGRIKSFTHNQTHAFVKFNNPRAISGFYHYTLLVMTPETFEYRMGGIKNWGVNPEEIK